ncbi:MAG: cyclic nucleotide-binding domain-containing protein [Acidobacteriota bacterium]
MLSWFGGEDDVGILINKKRYAKAAKVLREQLAQRPGDTHLRQRLADVLVLDGDGPAGLAILDQMVDEFAEDGFDAKAIAVLKKMQRIEPDRRDIEEKLTRLIKRRDQGVWQHVETLAVQTDAARDTRQEPVPDAAGDKLPAVQRSPLFGTFSAQELLAVIRGLNLLTFEAGEIIVSESEPGDSLFVVAAGMVRIYARNASGHNHQVRLLEEGEFFGEISLLSGKPRTATITAAMPTEILELDRETLDSIVVQHPQVPRVIREVSERRAMSPEERAARQAAGAAHNKGN